MIAYLDIMTHKKENENHSIILELSMSFISFDICPERNKRNFISIVIKTKQKHILISNEVLQFLENWFLDKFYSHSYHF